MLQHPKGGRKVLPMKKKIQNNQILNVNSIPQYVEKEKKKKKRSNKNNIIKIK